MKPMQVDIMKKNHKEILLLPFVDQNAACASQQEHVFCGNNQPQ